MRIEHLFLVAFVVVGIVGTTARGEPGVVGEPLMTIASASRIPLKNLEGPVARVSSAIPTPLVEALSIAPQGKLVLPLIFAVGTNVAAGIHTTTWLISNKLNLLSLNMPAAATQPASSGPFDALQNSIDLDEQEYPWSTTTSVHILAKTDDGIGRIVPFAALAREIDSLEYHERLGIGCGAILQLNKHASIGTELLYFGNREDIGEPFAREVRWVTRFELSF